MAPRGMIRTSRSSIIFHPSICSSPHPVCALRSARALLRRVCPSRSNTFGSWMYASSSAVSGLRGIYKFTSQYPHPKHVITRRSGVRAHPDAAGVFSVRSLLLVTRTPILDPDGVVAVQLLLERDGSAPSLIVVVGRVPFVLILGVGDLLGPPQDVHLHLLDVRPVLQQGVGVVARPKRA